MKGNPKDNRKKTIIILTILIIIWAISFYSYITYNKIDVEDTKYEAEKTISTEYEQKVENVEKESKNVADTIEEINESLVGITKLKNTGSSIFSKSDETDLGLGTGVIVTEDGYILSNAHVTGERFSKCYITLENGKNYEGFVVWSDTDLDLSITKIEAKNLKYAKLGDSGNIRVRRKCVCNRKSYRV